MGGISDLQSGDIVALRYLVSSLILAPLWFRYRFNLFNQKLVALSLTGGLAYSLTVYKGFELVPGSHAAILLPGLLPLLMTFLAVVINKEVCNTARTIGLLVISTGMALLLLQSETITTANLEGYLWIAAAAFCWSVFSVLLRRWNISAWQATVSLSFFTCMFYLPYHLFTLTSREFAVAGSSLWPQLLLQGFYQGVLASIVQMLLFVKAVEKIGAANMGAMMGLVPVMAGTASIFIFSEPVTLILVFGLLLVSTGTVISSGLLNPSNMFNRKQTRNQHALREYQNHQ